MGFDLLISRDEWWLYVVLMFFPDKHVHNAEILKVSIYFGVGNKLLLKLIDPLPSSYSLN